MEARTFRTPQHLVLQGVQPDPVPCQSCDGMPGNVRERQGDPGDLCVWRCCDEFWVRLARVIEC